MEFFDGNWWWQKLQWLSIALAIMQFLPHWWTLLPDRSNYLPFFTTPTTSLQINISLVSWARPFTELLCWRLICCSALLQNLVGNSEVTQCLEEAEQKAEASVDVPPPPLQIVISVPFCLFYLFSLSLSSLCCLSQTSFVSLTSFALGSTPSLLSLLINSLSSEFKFHSVSLLSEEPLACMFSTLPSPCFRKCFWSLFLSFFLC